MFLLRPPVDQDSKYILIVTRGPAFMSSAQCGFAVDAVTTETDPSGRATAVRGYRQKDGGNVLVCEFPLGTPYLLAARETVSMMTPEEIELERLQDNEDMKAFYAKYGVPAKDDDDDEEDARPPMQYL